MVFRLARIPTGHAVQSKNHPDRVRAAIATGLIVLAAITGCDRASAPSTVSVSRPAVQSNNDVAAQPVEAKLEVDVPQQPSQAQKDERQLEPPAATEAKTEKSPASVAPPPERIALLTPGGPLLVDVRLTIEGRPHTEVFEALVKRFVDAGDTDGDGRSKWKDLVANQDFLEGPLASLQSMGSRQMKTFIERYDENKDGQIQRGEVASLLGRDAGASASAFAVRSSRAYLPIPRATSQVWQLLDGDRNGRLSADEIRGASERFFLFDADDDRVITPPELASLREQLEAAAQRATSVSREASRYAVLQLEPGFEVDRLEYLLSDLYAPRQDLGPASFPELARWYAEVDANADNWLEQSELAKLLTIDPHLELAVSFEQAKGEKEAVVRSVTLRVVDHVPEIEVVAQPSADRVVLSLGKTRLIVSAHDLTPSQSGDEPAEQAAERSQIRLMAHDQCDALFEDIDTNADGKLGEREIASCPDRLLGRDANGDGALANDELPYSMIVAFLRGERPSEQSFYVPAYEPAAKGVADTPPWFLHADLNADGDISRREFLGTMEHFSQLDANQDNYIAAAEAAAFQSN